MSTWNNEAEAREQIKEMVAKYYHDFKEKITPYKEGERITYAARVFDEKEISKDREHGTAAHTVMGAAFSYRLEKGN